MEVTSAEYIDATNKIIKRGGPEVSEYEFIKQVPKEISDSEMDLQLEIYNMLKPILNVDSIVGHMFHKPYGYAGDFELIDRIYCKQNSTDEHLYKWDKFFHTLEGAEAVRNRKTYFKDLVNQFSDKHESICVLNLGSGPCRDLNEYLEAYPKQKIRFECLDMDKTAIEYGKAVCDNYSHEIKFINKNALTFNPGYQYELIWSAGLFDYFNDKIFVRLLRRIYALVKSGGELVIGNFSTYNPSRVFMEVYGQWFLHHRNKETLIELAMKADIPRALIEVSQEDVGVNLFLHLKKD